MQTDAMALLSAIEPGPLTGGSKACVSTAAQSGAVGGRRNGSVVAQATAHHRLDRRLVTFGRGCERLARLSSSRSTDCFRSAVAKYMRDALRGGQTDVLAMPAEHQLGGRVED
jgi:hypothetical protein